MIAAQAQKGAHSRRSTAAQGKAFTNLESFNLIIQGHQMQNHL
jgi:hypothetical protein